VKLYWSGVLNRVGMALCNFSRRGFMSPGLAWTFETGLDSDDAGTKTKPAAYLDSKSSSNCYRNSDHAF
jgi:hypothetical protein